MKRSLALIAALAASACVSGVAPAPVETVNRAEALAALMIGEFQTATDDTENTIRDTRMRVMGPDDGVWLYYQLNTGVDWKLYRQRVVELINDGDVVVQKTYGLKSPEKFFDFWNRPIEEAVVNVEDIEPYFDDGCEQRWMRGDDEWRGYVDPATCKIFSERRQANISIEAEARLDETTYKQTERGFDKNGEKLFGTAPDEFIVLYRQSSY